MLIASLRRLWPLGIRLQLTLWYTIVFAALLLFTGTLFYQHLEQSLEASLDTTLQLREQQLTAEVVINGNTITLSDGTGNLSSYETPGNEQHVEHVDVNNGVLVRLLDAHGKVVQQTRAFRILHPPQASITQPLHGTSWQGTVIAPQNQEVRIYSQALTEGGQIVALVQVGQSLVELHALLHTLVEELFVVGVVVLFACAIGSFWLAGRAFAPIQHLARTARHIKAGDLHQRVTVPQAHDEVQYLALTLNEMLDSLEQAFTRQRRFVADASHELRTPVAAIRSKTDVALLNARTREDYVMVLQAINTEAERLGHLISDLLALARGDEKRTQFDREVVRLDQIVEVVAANAEQLAAERNILLSVQTSEPVYTLGDEARLIQVVMNLLDNAILYTNAGGRVHVTAQATHTEARLVVSDTGIGIAPQHLPHLFERFYRADPARQRTRSSSTGLGLAIVDWVVRAHGGTVSVESQVGRGSTFTVTLPLAPGCA